MGFIFKLLKMLLLTTIGVPLLLVILYFIGSADVSLTQSNVDENLSVEEQIEDLELQVEKEKLQAKNDWEQIVRKASREGNVNKNRLLTSNFVDLNNIQTHPLEILTETEKTILNKRLQGNIVRFNGYIEKALIPDSDELFIQIRIIMKKQE